jgi:hypothetical protein
MGKDFRDLARKTALREIRRAFHEKHNVIRRQILFDAVNGGRGLGVRHGYFLSNGGQGSVFDR